MQKFLTYLADEIIIVDFDVNVDGDVGEVVEHVPQQCDLTVCAFGGYMAYKDKGVLQL